jgi:hypothetical protein
VAENPAGEFNLQKIGHRLKSGEIPAAPEEAGGQGEDVESQGSEENKWGQYEISH